MTAVIFVILGAVGMLLVQIMFLIAFRIQYKRDLRRDNDGAPRQCTGDNDE